MVEGWNGPDFVDTEFTQPDLVLTLTRLLDQYELWKFGVLTLDPNLGQI